MNMLFETDMGYIMLNQVASVDKAVSEGCLKVQCAQPGGKVKTYHIDASAVEEFLKNYQTYLFVTHLSPAVRSYWFASMPAQADKTG